MREFKIYISGPITGHHDFNARKFLDAEDQIWVYQKQLGVPEGRDIVYLNPIRNDGGETYEEIVQRCRDAKESGKAWLDYMRGDVKMIADADMVVTLSGWHNSRGAKVEVELALGLGLPVMYLPYFTGEEVDI